jgi:hypothetical protein
MGLRYVRTHAPYQYSRLLDKPNNYHTHNPRICYQFDQHHCLNNKTCQLLEQKHEWQLNLYLCSWRALWISQYDLCPLYDWPSPELCNYAQNVTAPGKLSGTADKLYSRACDFSSWWCCSSCAGEKDHNAICLCGFISDWLVWYGCLSTGDGDIVFFSCSEQQLTA